MERLVVYFITLLLVLLRVSAQLYPYGTSERDTDVQTIVSQYTFRTSSYHNPWNTEVSQFTVHPADGYMERVGFMVKFWGGSLLDMAANPETHQYYRRTQDTDIKQAVQDDIISAFGDVYPHNTFVAQEIDIITLENFTYTGGDATTPTNTVQFITMYTSSGETYWMFNIGTIGWWHVNNVYAEIGIGFEGIDGDSTKAITYDFPGSGTAELETVLPLGNSDVAGRWMFSMNTCANPSCVAVPNAFILQGSVSDIGTSVYEAACKTGYAGDMCQTVDPCGTSPCVHGQCQTTGTGGYTCTCDTGYTSTNCDVDIDDCTTNSCQNGTCVDLVGGYECSCYRGFGGSNCQNSLCVTDISNCPDVLCGIIPSVTSLFPTYGPIAGGTRLTITGLNFVFPLENVFVGSSQSVIKYSSRTRIEVLTPAVGSVQHQAISVVFTGGLTTYSKERFRYLRNPSISSIHPLKTIADGGTTITVYGHDMESVYEPVIEVTLNYSRVYSNGTEENIIDTFDDLCAVLNSTTVKCNTPEIIWPPELQGTNSTKAYVGFLFDGLDTFGNLSSNTDLERFSIITLRTTPTITPTDGDIKYQSGIVLTIKGTNLTAVDVSDYAVTVGDVPCEVTELQVEALKCVPPQEANVSSSHPLVRVSIGSRVAMNYTRLDYSHGDLLTKILAPVLSIVVLGLIIFIIVLVVKHNSTVTPKPAA